MSRYPLREIAERLAGAHDLETALDHLLGYLRAVQADWHPTVALYDRERETFDRAFGRERGRLERWPISVHVDHLPTRLVRKFLQPSAFFNGADRRSLLERLFQSSPAYQPDRIELAQVQPMAAPVAWRSCLILPLNDHDELLGLLVLVSPRENAFPPAVVEELQPLRSLASLSFARRMNAGGRSAPETRAAEDASQRTSAAVQERLRQLHAEATRLSAENQARNAELEALRQEVELLRRDSVTHLDERQRTTLREAALERQIALAARAVEENHELLSGMQVQLGEVESTLDLVRDAFDAVAGQPDSAALTRSFVAWFCEHFQVDRCSLMRLEDRAGQLRILAHKGIEPGLARRVRVPLGSGVAGWVAHHRRPVLMRQALDPEVPVAPTALEPYSSDSFMSLPLVYRNRVLGVLNLSNRREGRNFDSPDLERAQLAANVLAMALDSAAPAAEGLPA